MLVFTGRKHHLPTITIAISVTIPTTAEKRSKKKIDRGLDHRKTPQPLKIQSPNHCANEPNRSLLQSMQKRAGEKREKSFQPLEIGNPHRCQLTNLATVAKEIFATAKEIFDAAKNPHRCCLDKALEALTYYHRQDP